MMYYKVSLGENEIVLKKAYVCNETAKLFYQNQNFSF